MEDIIQFCLFLQLFGTIRCESVSFYFSIHENRVLNTRSPFIKSTYVKDLMLCARACGAKSNCNTANYDSEVNKCDLFKERMENSSHGTVMTTAKGFYLITKVRNYPCLFNRLLETRIYVRVEMKGMELSKKKITYKLK